MSDEPENLDNEPFERRYPDPHERDPVLEGKVQAVLAKRKRDRDDPEYNRLNAGHLSNRITDLEAFLDPLSGLLDSFRGLARDADKALELINVLEKVEAYSLDAKRHVGELRKLSDAMDAELGWYSEEICREWDGGAPEQRDGDDRHRAN